MGEVAEAYCYNLLGMICRAAGRCALAIEHFEKALSLQPTLWCAYQNMCQLGADVDPVNFFQV